MKIKQPVHACYLCRLYFKAKECENRSNYLRTDAHDSSKYLQTSAGLTGNAKDEHSTHATNSIPRHSTKQGLNSWTRGLVDCVFLIFLKCEKSTTELDMNSIFVLCTMPHCHQKERAHYIFSEFCLIYSSRLDKKVFPLSAFNITTLLRLFIKR